METMHAAGRRTLPPVPRVGGDRGPAVPSSPPADGRETSAEPSVDVPTQRFVVEFPTGEQRTAGDVKRSRPKRARAPKTSAPTAPDHKAPDQKARDQKAPDQEARDQKATAPKATAAGHRSDEVAAQRPLEGEPESALDAGQQFVARLRAAAPDFAEAAGAASAVVREAVPPARHRRARCRVVLRFADDTETDVTFLGSAGAPGTPSRHGFDRQIRRWLGAGQSSEAAWLVPDPDVPDGIAVDLSAWLAAG